MPQDLSSREVVDAIRAARQAAASNATRTVRVRGGDRTIPYPYPSPVDWREPWIYFVLLDRFNNPNDEPKGTKQGVAWNQRFDFRQGGTFTGVTERLDYFEALGVGALWLSPVVKNARPDDWAWNYHGYGAQNFIELDVRFASDGTLATAEKEFTELVDGAHARGIRIILDIVLNHAARVFDYFRGGRVEQIFTDAAVINGPLGSEPDIRWLDGSGQARAEWTNVIPNGQATSPDDAVYPIDLRRSDFFRRRGDKITDDPGSEGFVRGDFGDMRQLVFEYLASDLDSDLRKTYGPYPILTILVKAYSYLIARYDLDGLRIDTAKYVSATQLEWFGNAMREFGHSIGKRNIFTFGEIYDKEETIANFVGRNSTEAGSFGIDSALDFPLFFQLPGIAKALAPVERLRLLFTDRIAKERELLSSHGEAGRFFVSFLDNHDQHERFRHPSSPPNQITLGIALLFTLQGIPSLYYGTEAGLSGTIADDGSPDLTANESSREALWGKPDAFDTGSETFGKIATISRLRASEPAIRYGRMYFREVSANGQDFGHSAGIGGVVAFSRILADREVTVVANTNTSINFTGSVLRDPNIGAGKVSVAYSNQGTSAISTTSLIPNARFFDRSILVGSGPAVVAPIDLKPGEIQVLVPA
jgi:glycosidase